MTGEGGVRDDEAGGGGTRSGDTAGLPGPAPIIDLGGDAAPVRPVKPLGPRRLARLQRELAERSRELEELGGRPAGPELLEKQRRFAELAAQAAAANVTGEQEPDAGRSAAPAPWDPEHGVPEHRTPGAGAGPAEPGAAEPGAAEPGPAEPVERITVVFPEPGGPDGAEGHPAHDPVHVDPALFGTRLTPEELAALTHIEVLSPGGPAEPLPEAASEPAAAPGPESGPVRDAAAEPASSGPLSAGPEEEPEPPSPPLPATRAGGLELMDPGEYRSRPRWPAVALSVVLAAALAVLLVLFVL